MKTGTRKLISKEIQQDADIYVGEFGEVWFQEGSQTLRFGDDQTPGGVPLTAEAGGTSGPTVVCDPGINTVIFTASSSTVQSMKLVVQVQGYETGVVDFEDIQTCEIIAVKNSRLDTGDASVFGITYTSVNPLATFDAILVDDVLEVTVTPVSLTNGVTVNSLGFEII